jgi:hypothetical protein
MATAHHERDDHEDLGAHYVRIVKANQPSLLEAIAGALAGTGRQLADATWAE